MKIESEKKHQLKIKMILKFKFVDTNSKTIHQMKITFANEDTSVLQFLPSKNLDMLEVQTGESFLLISFPWTLNLKCLEIFRLVILKIQCAVCSI